MKKVYTLYQTNESNILGGYMAYPTLSEAMDALCPEKGVDTVIAVTCANAKWWNYGKSTNYLVEVISQGVIYRA